MAWKWFWNTEIKYYDGEINRDTDFKEDDVVNIGQYLANGKQFVRVRASFEYEDIATGVIMYNN